MRPSIKVPSTWEDYFATAENPHATNPKVYIASDTSEADFATSKIWQTTASSPWQADDVRHTVGKVASWSDE